VDKAKEPRSIVADVYQRMDRIEPRSLGTDYADSERQPSSPRYSLESVLELNATGRSIGAMVGRGVELRESHVSLVIGCWGSNLYPDQWSD
jgi:hypothetical protein